MDRRRALVTLLTPAVAGLWKRAAADAPEMRITRIDTVYFRASACGSSPRCGSTRRRSSGRVSPDQLRPMGRRTVSRAPPPG
jgi:hypothetical protein